MSSLAHPMSVFQAPYKALVIGANGAIGKAFVNALEHDAQCKHVEKVSRSLNQGFDLLDERSIASTAQTCRISGPYQIIVDATGALTMNGIEPEKSMANLQSAILLKNFEINAVGPVLAIKHFAPLLDRGPAIYAKLSARVGSISDNKKGGWYGYRAAKAALNMLLQTAAIELQRKNPQLHVVALQPGTVRSNLSQGFTNTVPELLEPEDSVVGMLNALKTLEHRNGAHFIDYKGKSIAW